MIKAYRNLNLNIFSQLLAFAFVITSSGTYEHARAVVKPRSPKIEIFFELLEVCKVLDFLEFFGFFSDFLDFQDFLFFFNF